MSMPTNTATATTQQKAPTTQQAGHKLMVSVQSHHMHIKLLHSAVRASSSSISSMNNASCSIFQFVLSQAIPRLKGVVQADVLSGQPPAARAASAVKPSPFGA